MHTSVSIQGIHCPSCAALIKDVSQDFPAIRSVDVDLHSKIVTLDHDARFSLADWQSAVEALNPSYKVSFVSEN